MHHGRVILGGIISALLATQASAQQPSLPSAEAPTVPSLAGQALADNPQISWYAANCRQPTLSAGASFYMLQPYFSSNSAFSTRTGITTAFPSEQSSDFSWDLQPAMSFWLGWTSASGLGVRGRYFHFDQESNTLTTSLSPAQAATSAIRPPAGLTNLAGSAASFGSPGIILGAGLGQDFLTFSSSLAIHTVDVEATKPVQWGPWALMLSSGGRYLHLAQDYRATLTNRPGGGLVENQTLTFARNFQGGGLTLATGVNRPLAILSGLSLYGNFRGSFLVGRSQQTASFTQVVNDPGGVVGGSQTLNPSTFSSRDTLLPVTEAELGIEYLRTQGRLQPLFRASVINQTYFDAGSASQSNGHMNLFGGQVSLGFNF